MPMAQGSLRYDRDTPEFARVANLSDAVFAIAMTLLVLTLDTPDPRGGSLATALAALLPQIIAFILAFALVANLWWQHHKLVAVFSSVEPGMIGIMLILLGLVALVPFPTSLIGNAPTDRVAVLAFVVVFTCLSVSFLLLVLRTRRVRAFSEAVDTRTYYWLLAQWVSGIVVLLVAALLTVWWPTIGLAILALTIVLGPVAARHGSAPSRRLSGRFLPDR